MGSAFVTSLFEDGTTVGETFTLLAHSRVNTPVASAFPSANGKRFGAIVETFGSAQIVVERAMYSHANGVAWAAGTNALATRLQ